MPLAAVGICEARRHLGRILRFEFGRDLSGRILVYFLIGIGARGTGYREAAR
jgi:hypothetical protein